MLVTRRGCPPADARLAYTRRMKNVVEKLSTSGPVPMYVEGRIVQLSVSDGGVPKTAVASARITDEGVEGDRQRDHENHGGPDRAVCLFSMERIRDLRREGHAIVPGTLGENVTIEGLDWETVQPNGRILLGEEVALEVTRYTSPCMNISGAFADGKFSRVSQKRHAGWSRVYARVLVPGTVSAGDVVRVLPPGVGETR